MKDRLGNDIKANDYIAYATREGSTSCALRIGRVLSAEMVPTDHYVGPATVPNISVVIAASRHRLGVEVAKKTTTSLPERCVVLHPDTIPESYKLLLGVE